MGKTGRKSVVVAVLLVALWSSGCAWRADKTERADAHSEFAEQRERLTHWSVRGRAAVRTGGDGATLSLRWRQLEDVFAINLSGPFGTGAVQISGQPGAVVLNNGSGQVYSAPNPEALLAAHTGYDLPVSALRYWILGDLADGLEVERRDYAASGRPEVIVQGGWRIEYRRWTQVDAIFMPARIDISKGSKQLRVALSGWQVSYE